jgi:UDP-2,3-diacylglucosamine pyrophosphatase LpxH
MYIVISDMHIGDEESNKNLEKLYSLLEKYIDYTLILNGDIFDLIMYSKFDGRHNKLLNIISKYKEVFWIVGNHDWLVGGLTNICNVKFQESLIIEWNGKKIKFIHGHQADNTIVKYPRFSRFLVRANQWIDKIFKINIRCNLYKIKYIQKYFIEKQEAIITENEKDASIMIVGHTHILKEGLHCRDIIYYNCGSWLGDDCNYIIIDENNITLNKA